MKYKEWRGEVMAKSARGDEVLGRRASRDYLLEARLTARRSAAAERARVRETLNTVPRPHSR